MAYQKEVLPQVTTPWGVTYAGAWAKIQGMVATDGLVVNGVTFTADTDYDVGVDDVETASNAVAAINASADEDIDDVVYATNRMTASGQPSSKIYFWAEDAGDDGLALTLSQVGDGAILSGETFEYLGMGRVRAELADTVVTAIGTAIETALEGASLGVADQGDAGEDPWLVHVDNQPATISLVDDATWDSETVQDTALSLEVNGYGNVGVMFSKTGTIDAGQINFEVSTDEVHWYAIDAARITGYVIENAYSLTYAGMAWKIFVGGMAHFRVRLHAAITNTGTASIRVMASLAGSDISPVVHGDVTVSALTGVTQLPDALGPTTGAASLSIAQASDAVDYVTLPCIPSGAPLRFNVSDADGKVEVLTSGYYEITCSCDCAVRAGTTDDAAVFATHHLLWAGGDRIRYYTAGQFIHAIADTSVTGKFSAQLLVRA